MKKTILCLFITISFLVSCNDNDSRNLSFNNLPNEGQSFITEYFSDLKISQSMRDDDGSYDVRFTNGTEIDFDAQGRWTSVKASDRQALLHTSFIPNTITSYITQNYPKNAINSIERIATGYEVELLGLTQELIFDKNGNFVRLNK